MPPRILPSKHGSPYSLDLSDEVLASLAKAEAAATDLALTNPVITNLTNLEDFADDAAAATGEVPVGGFYRNGSILMVRVA